jgi:hypothetical protein
MAVKSAMQEHISGLGSDPARKASLNEGACEH